MKNISIDIAMKITIKRANITHANAISFIGRRSFHDAFAHLFYNKDELQEYLDYAYSVDKIAGSIRKSNNVFFLAFANERPVGFVKLKKHSLNPQIDSFAQMELQKIYVLKEYHGTGAGQSLMDAALEFAQSEVRPEYIWLDTHITNDRAVRFYEKNGFQVCGRHYFTIGTQMFEYHLMNQMVAIEVTA